MSPLFYFLKRLNMAFKKSENNVLIVEGQPMSFDELGKTLKRDALAATSEMSNMVARALQGELKALMGRMDTRGHRLDSKGTSRNNRPFGAYQKSVTIRKNSKGARLYIKNKVFHALDQGTEPFYRPSGFPMVVPAKVAQAYKTNSSITKHQLTKANAPYNLILNRDVPKVDSVVIWTRQRKGMKPRRFSEKAVEVVKRKLFKEIDTSISDVEDPYYEWSTYAKNGRLLGKKLNFVYLPKESDIKFRIQKGEVDNEYSD